MSRVSGSAVAQPPVGVRGFRFATVAAAVLVAIAAVTAAALERSNPLAGSASTEASDRAKMPLSFIPNRGQLDRRVSFYVQGSGQAFYFTPEKAVLSFSKKEKGLALHLTPIAASPNARLEAGRPAPGKVNYFVGPERHANIPTYQEIAYRELWPGIDLVFKGSGGVLKYELHLQPGADPSRIGFSYAGASDLSLGNSGRLLIHTPLGTVREQAPRSYQMVGGRRVPVESHFALRKGTAYGFALGPSYDRRRPLVIDPALIYSTYLGGTGTDLGNGLAIDGAGNVYLTGRTGTGGFPTTAGAFDTSTNGSDDAFVAKLNPSGSALDYSTFLGGTGAEEATAIAIDDSGSAYVTGSTTSANFPTTGGAFDTTPNGGDNAFVAKLNPSGSALDYSSFLGGMSADYGNGIAVDGAGDAYITGYTLSGDFPTTVGAFDTTNAGFFDAFAAKLDASGSALDYSTFLGGSDSDIGGTIAVDETGSAYVTGGTRSLGFPTTAGAFDTTQNGIDDAFVTKLNASGSALSYSTFLGGTGTDGSSGITFDDAGNTYLTGFTDSDNFPTTAGAFDTVYDDGGDAFVAKLDAAGSALAYSTYLGGASYDSGSAIVQVGGTVYVAGRTDSPLFPTTPGAFDTIHNGVGDVFVVRLNDLGSLLLYSTFVGGTMADTGTGIAVAGNGNAYVSGYTGSSDYPTTSGAFDTTSNGGNDAFVTKLSLETPYPKPTGATPIRVPLVPAFRECGLGETNSLHGGGLPIKQTCKNPGLVSDTATLGNSTTLGTRLGHARVIVCTNLTAPGCESLSSVPDVRLFGNGSDIVCKAGASPTACPGGAGSDYDPNPSPGFYTAGLAAGTNSNKEFPTPICSPSPPNPASCSTGADMTAQAAIPNSTSPTGSTIRVTDGFNSTPSDGDSPTCTVSTACSATVVDQAFAVPVVCQPTADTTIGSYCGANTTANALVPGLVVSGKAAVVEIGEIQILDSGPDGVRANPDDQLFAVQGFFVP